MIILNISYYYASKGLQMIKTLIQYQQYIVGVSSVDLSVDLGVSNLVQDFRFECKIVVNWQ